MPGYGLSESAIGYGFTLREQATVLKDFVLALDLRNIIVWGNDGGGPTTMLALSGLADKVLGLVMAGTFGWSIRDYHSVTRTLRVVTSSPGRFFNRYTNFLAVSSGTRFALGKRRLTKAEKKHYSEPFAERGSRSRPLRLFASFIDKKTQESLDSASQALSEKPILIQFGVMTIR
jgi:pimeloyl-ACP methyl ester carboxylesterase